MLHQSIFVPNFSLPSYLLSIRLYLYLSPSHKRNFGLLATILISMQNLITSIIFGTEGVRECSHHKDVSSHFYLFQNLTMLLHRSFLPMAVSPSGLKKLLVMIFTGSSLYEPLVTIIFTDGSYYEPFVKIGIVFTKGW